MKTFIKKTGIFGGTFNPVHNGHIYVAGRAMEAIGLDEVLWIPSGTSYMKDQRDIAPAELRLEMVRLSIEGLPGHSLSDMEVKRSGSSYTWETIAELRSLCPERQLYLIVGADTLFMLDKWRNPGYIMEEADIVALLRREDVSLPHLPGTNEEELSRIREKAHTLSVLYGARIHIVEAEPVDISSTQVRRACKAGEDISGMVPVAVAGYIAQRGLYS